MRNRAPHRRQWTRHRCRVTWLTRAGTSGAANAPCLPGPAGLQARRRLPSFAHGCDARRARRRAPVRRCQEGSRPRVAPRRRRDRDHTARSSRPHNPRSSQRPDGRLPHRQVLRKLRAAATSPLVRTDPESARRLSPCFCTACQRSDHADTLATARINTPFDATRRSPPRSERRLGGRAQWRRCE